jgi:hypothetical protein
MIRVHPRSRGKVLGRGQAAVIPPQGVLLDLSNNNADNREAWHSLPTAMTTPGLLQLSCSHLDAPSSEPLPAHDESVQ